MKRKKYIYISGPLTRLKEPEKVKKFYEQIGEVCKEAGFSPYVPHLRTDPVKNADISPQEVWFTDFRLVKNACLLIAYVDEPSLGVGAELEIARYNGVPCILLYRKDGRVSRMARGNPAVLKEVIFEDFKDCLFKLKKFLERKGEML